MEKCAFVQLCVCLSVYMCMMIWNGSETERLCTLNLSLACWHFFLVLNQIWLFMKHFCTHFVAQFFVASRFFFGMVWFGHMQIIMQIGKKHKIFFVVVVVVVIFWQRKCGGNVLLFGWIYCCLFLFSPCISPPVRARSCLMLTSRLIVVGFFSLFSRAFRTVIFSHALFVLW